MTSAINPTESGINQTDYLKLFMQELTYQDPMKPVDNREFMAQMAQFSALQSTKAASDSLAKLEFLNQDNKSLMLLGKKIRLADNQEGVVNAIFLTEGAAPRLRIQQGQELIMRDLNEITMVD